MKRLLIATVLLIITACTNNEPAIEKAEATPDKPDGDAELVEQVSEEEVEEFIEFYLDDEQITINLQMVPILKEFLHSTKDRKKAIEEMNFERVKNDDQSIYLLEFSCKNNLCSYLVFNQNKGDQTYLIADLAKSIDILESPDNTKLLFLFQRDSSLSLPLTNIVVIDTENWVRLSLINETTDYDILNYKWPLISVNWIDNETISVMKPASIEPEDEEDGGLPMTNVILRTIDQSKGD